jgi:hypothetical protein
VLQAAPGIFQCGALGRFAAGRNLHGADNAAAFFSTKHAAARTFETVD